MVDPNVHVRKQCNQWNRISAVIGMGLFIRIGALTNKIKFEAGAYESGSANWNVGYK